MAAISRRVWRRPGFLVVTSEVIPVAERGRNFPPRVLLAVAHVHRTLINSSRNRWPVACLPKRGGIVKRHASANEEDYPEHHEDNRTNTGEKAYGPGKKSLHNRLDAPNLAPLIHAIKGVEVSLRSRIPLSRCLSPPIERLRPVLADPLTHRIEIAET